MTGFLRRARLAKAVVTLSGAAIFLSTTGCAAPPGLGTPPAFYPASVDDQQQWMSGDYDGDGSVDFAVIDVATDVVTVLLNDGAGTLTATSATGPVASAPPSSSSPTTTQAGSMWHARRMSTTTNTST